MQNVARESSYCGIVNMLFFYQSRQGSNLRIPFTFFVKCDWDYFFLVKLDLGFFIYS